MNDNPLLVAAPWSLTGSAYIILLRLPLSMRETYFSNTSLKYRSPFSICMLVHYDTSPVGSYDEILFIPGQLLYLDKWHWSVSNMWVTSGASVMSGKENWGFPKKLAQISFNPAGERKEIITAAQGSHLFARISCHSFGPYLSINTGFFPSSCFSLLQIESERKLLVTPKAQLSMSLAKINEIKIDPDYFPAIDQMHRLMVFHVKQFSLVFPRAIG